MAPFTVPVVLRPVAQVYVSASAETTAAMSTSVSASVSALAGVEYLNERFAPLGGVTPKFDYSPPTLTASGSAQAAVTPTIDVKINGIGGPSVDLSAGLKLAADPHQAPWWKLTAPVDLGAKLSVDVWKLHVASNRLKVWGAEPQLGAASDAAPTPPAPPPPPPPAPGPMTRASIAWDTDADVDLHIWDEQGNHAYFGELDAIPGSRLVFDVIPGFGPEEFVEDVDPGRTYTYGLCLYSGGSSDGADVTLTATDPGGATRTFDRTLAGTKDAALVTTSPAGGAFVPEPGWCGDDDPTEFG